MGKSDKIGNKWKGRALKKKVRIKQSSRVKIMVVVMMNVGNVLRLQSSFKENEMRSA